MGKGRDKGKVFAGPRASTRGRGPDLLKSAASPGEGSNLLKSRQPLMSTTPG